MLMILTWSSQQLTRVRVQRSWCILKLGQRQTTCSWTMQRRKIRLRSKRGKEVQLPPSQPDIERVNSITALGVVINDQLTATYHVSYILTACTSLMYALRVLRCHGIPDRSVFKGRVSGYCRTNQNYLLLASVVWALYSSWSYKTQLLSETVR